MMGGGRDLFAPGAEAGACPSPHVQIVRSGPDDTPASAPSIENLSGRELLRYPRNSLRPVKNLA